MSLQLASLNSGSNGNCYYVGNEHDAVLVDAGISCRSVEKRLQKLGLTIEKVRAVFISHEHTDHVKGIEVLSKKHQIPVYISPVTYLNSLLPIEPELVRTFSGNEKLEIGSLKVHAVPKLHDGIDPFSFTVSYNSTTAGVFTDIGEACANVIHHFSQCHGAFLEANYDEMMLETGRYPIFLKNRIRSSVGHLSNMQALELFNTHRHSDLSVLVLSHLSQHNNHPDIVTQLFSQHANGTRIEIAPRYHESEVFWIG